MSNRRVFHLAAGLDGAHHHLARLSRRAPPARPVPAARALNRCSSCCIRSAARAPAEDGPRARPARQTMQRCHRPSTERRNRRSDVPHRSSASMRVDNRACLLGVEVCHQFGRTLDVGEQCCDRLALTLEILGRRQRLSLLANHSILLLRVLGDPMARCRTFYRIARQLPLAFGTMGKQLRAWCRTARRTLVNRISGSTEGTASTHSAHRAAPWHP